MAGEKIKLIECPRDAMQGLHDFIPTEEKAKYINQLLRVGFDTIDFGSFVSPKAIPQMRDTEEVLGLLELGDTISELLVIVANLRGAKQAASFEQIQYLGFPLSLSETFQQRNTNRSVAAALETIAEIQVLCSASGKQLVTYLSMGFGNPYGDPWAPEYAANFVEKLKNLGIGIISLADTIGVSNPESIRSIFSEVTMAFPDLEFGVHLHSTPQLTAEKVEAAFEAGCRRIDGALLGIGGCPMAKDDLTGNLATEIIVKSLKAKGIDAGIDENQWSIAMQKAEQLFSSYH